MSELPNDRAACAIEKYRRGLPAWGLSFALVLTGISTFIFPKAAAAEELAWILQPPGCLRPENTGTVFDSFSCGDIGRFTFSNNPGLLNLPATSCTALYDGQEEPKRYNSITPLPPIGGGQPLAPCVGPACFDTQIPAGDGWVAVIDWDDWHGQAVSWMIKSLSGRQPVLFDLGDGLPAGGTTDIHVLRQLCRLADHIDDRGEAPAAVNMSFGRVSDDTGQANCASDAKPKLGCMVEKALDHLSKESSLFAASGNHDTLLFPASANVVSSVGGLDVAWFNHSDQAGASWQTPDQVENLMPASSLCLDDQAGDPWAAPPGSSWSSAILASWVVRSNPSPSHRSAGGWHPVVASRSFHLASHLGMVPLSSAPPIDELFNRLRGAGEGTCFNTGGLNIEGVRVKASRLAAGLSADPIIYLHRASSQPTPDPDPCLPCTGGWDDGPPGGIHGLTADSLQLNLTESPGVPDDLKLVGLRLVINRGAQFFDLSPVEISPTYFHSMIERAGIGHLLIENLQSDVLPGDELSLVYLFESPGGPYTESFGSTESTFGGLVDTDGKKPTVYWSATTIHLGE